MDEDGTAVTVGGELDGGIQDEEAFLDVVRGAGGVSGGLWRAELDELAGGRDLRLLVEDETASLDVDGLLGRGGRCGRGRTTVMSCLAGGRTGQVAALEIDLHLAAGGGDAGFLVVVEFAAGDPVVAVALGPVKGDHDVMERGAGPALELDRLGGVDGESGAALDGLGVGESLGGAFDLSSELAWDVEDEPVGLVAGIADEESQRGEQQDRGRDNPEPQPSDGYAHGRLLARGAASASTCPLLVISSHAGDARRAFARGFPPTPTRGDGWRCRSAAGRRW